MEDILSPSPKHEISDTESRQHCALTLYMLEMHYLFELALARAWVDQVKSCDVAKQARVLRNRSKVIVLLRYAQYMVHPQTMIF